LRFIPIPADRLGVIPRGVTVTQRRVQLPNEQLTPSSVCHLPGDSEGRTVYAFPMVARLVHSCPRFRYRPSSAAITRSGSR